MMLIRNIFLFAILLTAVISCSPEKKAQQNFKYAKYERTIAYYKKVLTKQPNNPKANYYVAEAYRLSNRLKDAEPYYGKIKDKGVHKDSMTLMYAKALQANGKYEESKKELIRLDSSIKDNEKFKKQIDSELAGVDNLVALAQQKNYYRVKNLETINTPFADYGPAFSNNQLYFTSSRANAKIFESSGTPYSDLYQADSKGANVDVGTLKAMPDNVINMADINTGCITFSPDGKLMIFARGNTGRKKGAPDVDLYLSRFRNGAWTAAVPINVNLPDSWESTPALSPDGRTLYFSSNRKDGYGGLDLYSAQMDSRGRFGKVKNLGEGINTAGDELFPYVAENGKMYFSSDGHPGYGMLDIFVVNRTNGKYSIDNLGPTMNSSSDDFGMFLFKPDRGFFSSNRDGGKGDDDIYTFVNDDPNLKVVNYFLRGVTYSVRKDSTREILPDTKISLLAEDGDVMQDFTTGNDGKFLFRVYENENYFLMGERDGYITKRQPFTTKGKSVSVETLKDLITNITLDTLMILDKKEKGKIFVLNNIYFEYDKADINRDAAHELDKLVQLLNDNPELKIEMGSHTDSVASDAYNLELSQRRAESTVHYLIRKGIAPERLVAKGYGESKPIARNTNPDGTDNPIGRQKNRRTEFRILEIGPAVKKAEEDDDDKYFKDEKKEKEEN